MKGESFKTWAFRNAMNWYPMFFGTGGKVLFIKANWQHATIRLNLNIWTYNYVGTIFGGSQFSAMDPFHTVLLINCLGDKYIVWDKAAAIQFKKPGKSKVTAEIKFDDDELERIREEAQKNGRYEFVKTVEWIDSQGQVISTVDKTLYVATKEYFKARQAAKNQT